MVNPRQGPRVFDDVTTNTNSLIGIIIGMSTIIFGILVCICVLLFMFRRKSRARPQRYETNRYPIQPEVTSRVIYSENERYITRTRTQQLSPFLVPIQTPTSGSLNSTQPSHVSQPSHMSHFTQSQPSRFQQQVQPTYMHNTSNTNRNTTNNSVLATDAPPSYNASHAFKNPEINVQREDLLPTYNEALTLPKN